MVENNTYVIGDIHGGLHALQQVLIRANVTPNDTLIFLGDYVDGWSDSPRMAGYLTKLAEKNKCVFIRGNHDANCARWLQTGYAEPSWALHGGHITIENYDYIDEEQKFKDAAFYNSTMMYYIDDKKRLFVHAGYNSPMGVEEETDETELYYNRNLWKRAVDAWERGVKLAFLQVYNEIFIGHTPTTKLDVDTPMCCCNVWNVDTGAAFKGRLSIMNIDTYEFWQSDPLPELYPTERGRNEY